MSEPRAPAPWFAEYGACHAHPANELIHAVCVPLVLAALLGLAWSAPVPEAWLEIVPWFNWVLLFIAITVTFYVRLSLALSAGILLFLAVAYTGIAMLDFITDRPLWRCCAGALLVAGTGLALGNRLESRRPTLRQRFVFPLLAPAWLVGRLYQRVGQRF